MEVINMETDLGKIEKLAQEKEEENFNFENYLKGCNHHEVDKTVHKLNKKYLEEYDCTECGNCCKKLAPALSLEETEDLARHLKISYEEFKKKYIERETAEGILFKDRVCPFLDENKCSVYECRPEVCRSYPHLHKDNINHRLLNLINNTFICPIVYNIMEDLKIIFKFKDID